MPGTETKVTPDMQEPIMAMATTHHFSLRSPLKNVMLPAPREEMRDTVNIRTK